MQRRLARHPTSTTTTTSTSRRRSPKAPALDPFDGTALQFLPSFAPSTPSPQQQQQQQQPSWDDAWGATTTTDWGCDNDAEEEEKKSDTSGYYSASSFRQWAGADDKQAAAAAASSSSPDSSYVGWWPGTQDPKGNTIAETKEWSRTTDPTVSHMTDDDDYDDDTPTISPIRQSLSRELFPSPRVSLSRQAYLQQQQQQYNPILDHDDDDNNDDPWTPDPEFAPVLTRDALAEKNRCEPTVPSGYSPAARGFTGLLHKTSPVPCLLDKEDDDASAPSSPASSSSSHKPSDIFDGLSHISDSVFHDDVGSPSPPPDHLYNARRSHHAVDHESFRMVPLGFMGLQVIQSSPENFRNRSTADDFDDALTDSDVSTSDGYPKIPAIAAMRHAGRRTSGALMGLESNVLEDRPYAGGDTSTTYVIDPEAMEAVVDRYRSLSSNNTHEDDAATKLFALTEMRSRILEADVERGVERCGGTTVVDDTVTTTFMTTAHSVRDAMIVAKTWRDGATIQDVVHTARLAQPRHPTRWWLDDVDVLQFRCPSLGPRYLRGFDMFTIGDCQSMLLKLANDRCMELRHALHDATVEQLLAEEHMNEREDLPGMMSDAEMVYLAAMEQTKTVSRQLMAAEQSFTFVKESVERLISKYERLLATIETGSLTGSMLSTNSRSDCGSEYWERFDRLWARRKRRAEVQAELAAREAALVTVSAYARREKQKEIFQLREQLLDLRSEASSAHHHNDVARTLSRRLPSTATSNHTNNNKDRLSSVKQRFRDRARQQQRVDRPELALLRSAGQEMVQQKDFYERSLRAVER